EAALAPAQRLDTVGRKAVLLHQPGKGADAERALVLPVVERRAAIRAADAARRKLLLVGRRDDHVPARSQEAADLCQRRRKLILEQVLDHLDQEDDVQGGLGETARQRLGDLDTLEE